VEDIWLYTSQQRSAAQNQTPTIQPFRAIPEAIAVACEVRSEARSVGFVRVPEHIVFDAV
jgi:hypothetical protein